MGGQGAFPTAAASHAYSSLARVWPPAALSPPVAWLPTTMEYVGGQEVSPEVLSDGSWQSTGLSAQDKHRVALRRAAAAKTMPTTMPASPPPPSPPSKQTSASPSRPRRRAPIPRLPADTIHVVAANLRDLPPASRDTVRIHPVNNTFTLSVADTAHAQAYLRITSLTVSGTTFTVRLHAPPPDDALRGILYHAFDDFTLSIVGDHRMGKTPHILVALTEPKVPRWILYHGVHLSLLAFHNNVKACFNCRSTDHRTDVCLKARQDRSHRCGAIHPPPP
ncbi:hypothetical protein HPB52_001867 [Rhipicephalus sanguineus]|uniref:Uncharacterized protein n=1 Tax=Rhipicephalus sanguineus TaxID=34632 RepID=A0A9D4T170_RHISA|nr:hypothetical protein HPB52_001867 [Rhipicephalus sanguineus]